MKKGGFYDCVMNAGKELDRVKDYLRALAGEIQLPTRHPAQAPSYPVFPEISVHPFRDTKSIAGVKLLQDQFPMIREEADRLLVSDYLQYFPRGIDKVNPTQLRLKSWGLNFIYYMGEKMEGAHLCPGTSELICSLAGTCLGYPWGDAVFSVQAAGSNLSAHCSVDNLRVRCHLGLSIPDSCGIRVGEQKRKWREGECLLFDDSIEHEVWNNSKEDRLVLILDFWNPELTEIEREVLTAGFRKSEVRKLFAPIRIRNTTADKAVMKSLEAKFEIGDSDPLIKKYWH
ncbi:MAG: aspartyl/asparaginyl beta-hydroxylase domain-containing protein [Gammaproteobacteria bacterium]|nr:aspartyl/asparaginyl beta-hydroxylase domain-containing protein [Pseudomonadales bacterium]